MDIVVIKRKNIFIYSGWIFNVIEEIMVGKIFNEFFLVFRVSFWVGEGGEEESVER